LAAKQKKKSFTEDAVLVHKMSKATVHALPGDQRNIKVTSPKDLVLVSQLMSLEK
jgi:2-C-methyl-D-erythritol 4-phosphate cytidylyltransferase